MTWNNDKHGLVFKSSELKLYYDGGHSWANKLCQIHRQTGKVRIVTYSLPDLPYVIELVGKRPADIWLIANSKFRGRARAIKQALPTINIALVRDVHTKVCIIEPKTVYITSANFGASHWHETTIGVRSVQAVGSYLEHSFWPLWERSEVLEAWPEKPKTEEEEAAEVQREENYLKVMRALESLDGIPAEQVVPVPEGFRVGHHNHGPSRLPAWILSKAYQELLGRFRKPKAGRVFEGP